jgi:dTDP-D-glucose 4,6-dehydratase
MSYVKLNKMFGWKPHTEIKEGLRSTYKWYNGFLKKYNYKDFL